MNATAVQLEQELWEAWIEFDQLNPKNFGTLYVLGEALTGNKKKLSCISRCEEKSLPGVLALNLPEIDPESKLRSGEVIYAENIGQIGHYHTIRIFQGAEMVVELSEIEVLV
ncbi:MAG: hypothetical protein H0U44_11785 [Flavisolibacter sp.]|jgi:hypothetical protein|nr:hypothetical protein [Flavisolibacter sp.]